MGSMRGPQDGTRDWLALMWGDTLTIQAPLVGTSRWPPHVGQPLQSGTQWTTHWFNCWHRPQTTMCRRPWLPVQMSSHHSRGTEQTFQVRSRVSTLLCMCLLGFQTHRSLFNLSLISTGLQRTLTWPASQSRSEVMLKSSYFGKEVWSQNYQRHLETFVEWNSTFNLGQKETQEFQHHFADQCFTRKRCVWTEAGRRI